MARDSGPWGCDAEASAALECAERVMGVPASTCARYTAGSGANGRLWAMEPMVRRFRGPADIPAEHGPDPPPVNLSVPARGFQASKKKGLAACAARPSNIGRSGGIRTRDPLLPKQMRYQAALRSDSSYSNPPNPHVFGSTPAFLTFFRKCRGEAMTERQPKAAT